MRPQSWWSLRSYMQKNQTKPLPMSAFVIYLTKPIFIIVLIFDASIRFPGIKEIESLWQGYGELNYG